MDNNRIQFLLSKVYEIINSKHPKSAIDADLLLDYLRVMYADVLELRKEWANENDNVNNILPKSANKELVVPEDVVEPQDSLNEAPASVEPVIKPLGNKKHAHVELEEYELNDFQTGHNIHIVKEDLAQKDDIYFEEPHSSEYNETIHIDEIEEELIIPETSNSDKPVSMPASMKKNEIRKLIGLNDRYLFLNELFNNNKFDYESALDYINGFTSKNEAEEWLNKTYIERNKWDKADKTVVDFYEIVSRYFSNFN